MARYYPIAAWFLSCLSLALIIVINAAGTAIVHGGPFSAGPAHDILSSGAILSITIPNLDVDPSGYNTIVYNMYLNGACADGVFITVAFPFCLSSSPGPAFNLTRLLEDADPNLYYVSTHGNIIAVHSTATTHLHLPPIHKIVPFIFYVIAASNTALLIVLVPRSWKGRRRRREAALHFSIAGGSFAALLCASAILCSQANSAMRTLQRPENAPYVGEITSRRGYQGFTWGCTAAALLAALLLGAEWDIERFTPFGQGISRHWKPAAVSWFGRRPAELREQQRRMEPMVVEDGGEGSGSGDEWVGGERRRPREFVSFDARLRAMAMERRARGMVGGQEQWRMERWG